MGLASAMSIVFFLLVLVITIIQLKFFRVGEREEVA